MVLDYWTIAVCSSFRRYVGVSADDGGSGNLIGKPQDRGPSPSPGPGMCSVVAQNFPSCCQTSVGCVSVSCSVARVFLVVELFFVRKYYLNRLLHKTKKL